MPELAPASAAVMPEFSIENTAVMFAQANAAVPSEFAPAKSLPPRSALGTWLFRLSMHHK